MIRGQLHEIARQLQALLDDLAANNLSDVDQAAALEAVRSKLTEIAESHVGQAAALLRELSTASTEIIRSVALCLGKICLKSER